MTRKRKLPPNVSAFIDRHGKERFRYRKTGQKTHSFKAVYGTPEFQAEYEACRAGAPVSAGADRILPGTVADLVSRFYKSAAFNSGGEDFRRTVRAVIEGFRQEFGQDRVEHFTFEHIEAILLAKSKKRQEGKRLVGGPAAAHRLRKQLVRLFNHAVKVGMIASNPVLIAEKVKVPQTGGYHTWTEEEIAQFQERHPLGTKSRLALEILLWTGARRSDARTFGPSHVRGGKMRYTQSKTGKTLWLPLAPQLLQAIEAMPTVGISTYLVTEFGKPFSKAGFGNWFRDRCDEAGLPQCTAHGLRKAISRRMAEQGAGNQGIKSVTGHSGDDEVARYTAAVDQERLAEATLGRVSAWDLANRQAEDLANRAENG